MESFVPRRAWFRLQGPDARTPGSLGVVADGDWHSLEPLLGDGAYDTVARLADGTLTAAGLASLAAELGDATRLSERPAFGIPVDRPGKILCLGKNYRAHAAEFGSETPEEPMFFNKLPECLLPDGGDVRRPEGAGRVDHEAELCAVIGRAASHAGEDEARTLVAGWTLIDDVTARHLQGEDRKKRFPWLRSKSFDTFGPLGPWVVPFEDVFPDEVPDDATPDLGIEAVVNGDVRQSSRTSLMVHRIAPTLAYLSRHTTLRAGDLIATGTPEGVSELRSGDVVEVRCEGIGCLRHGVV